MLRDRRIRLELEALEDRCVPATITVTNLNEGTGAGVPGMTLREAVKIANVTIAADTIVFKAGLKGTITLTDGPIEIATSMKINGPGASKVTIDGAGNTIFDVNDSSPDQVNVSIRKLSLTGSNGFFGAISSEENLTLGNLRVFANQSAAIQAGGDLTLLNCTIHGNLGGFAGGVDFGGTGTLTVTGCSFFDNRASTGGGALTITGGSAIISKSTFAENRATGNGGAILSSFGSNLTLSTCSFIGNQAGEDGGAIFSEDDTLALSNCSIIGNQAGGFGGGLFFQTGSYQIRGSTIAYNAAETGGGLLNNDATITFLNSTISGNRATTNGGGLANLLGDLTLHNSTVAYNVAEGDGGGIHTNVNVNVNLVSTIVARNFAGTAGPDLFSELGAIYQPENCLIGDTTGANIDFDPATITNVNPLLGPLQNNGGLTFTHALQAGSPALNVGSNPDNLTTDQRGAGFARVKGSGIDIGAFER